MDFVIATKQLDKLLSEFIRNVGQTWHFLCSSGYMICTVPRKKLNQGDSIPDNYTSFQRQTNPEISQQLELETDQFAWRYKGRFFECINHFRDIICERIDTTPQAQQTLSVKVRRSQENLADMLKEVKRKKEVIEFREELKWDVGEMILRKDECNDIERISSFSVGTLTERKYCTISEYAIDKERCTKGKHKSQRRNKETMKHSEMHETPDNWSEVVFRNTCLKRERRYICLLSKYDREIGMRYTLLERLIRERDLLQKQEDDLKSHLNTQRSLYKRLIRERESNKAKHFIEIVDRFQQNHAAKVIQEAWKIYRETLLSSKKRRKLRRR